MILFHIGFSLELIALAAGTALYVWGTRNNGAGTTLAKIMGFLILVLSLIAVISTIFFNIKMWQEYHSRGSMGMMMQPQTVEPVAPVADNKKKR